ncbi:MAG: hypothetical protein JW746_09440 [Candidatus Krumholzibacteriota bacterium]|nr:hypothetical protein [Candidatus Krumholzibacteriota bacterium]
MQKGKGLCSIIGTWKMTVAVFLAIAALSPDLSAFDHLHSWNSGMGGVERLGPDRDYLFSDSSSVSKGIFVSSSKPYSLEDLTAVKLESYFSTERTLFIAGLGSLKHDLYHEELFQARVFIAFFRESVILGAAASMLRKNISGSDPLVTWKFNGSVSIGKKNIGRLVLRTGLCRDDAGEFYSPFFSLSMVISPVELILDFDSLDWMEGDNRVGVIIPADSNFYLLSGYRAATGEVSGGVLCRSGKLILSVSCSSHPVLGETFCFGAARMWR